MVVRLRRHLGLTAVFALMLLFSAARAEAVRIGILLPLSGPLAEAGQAARNGFELAAESADFGPSAPTLHVADTAGTSEGGRSAAIRLIRDERVTVMAGCIASPAAWSAAAVAEDAGVPLLIGGAASNAITESSYRSVFRINPPVEGKYAALRAFLDRFLPPRRDAAILCEDLAPALALSEQWLKRAPELGLDPLFRVRYLPGRIDYRPDLAKARVEHPSVLVLISAPADAALMLRQRRQLNLTPRLMLGEAPGILRPDFAQTAGDACESLLGLVPWTASVALPGARRFSQAYFQRYGRLPGYHEAFSFAGLHVVADAVSRAGTASKSAVSRALAETDLTTICGRVRFSAQGPGSGQNRLPWLVVQWQSGRLETVWPRGRASAEPHFP